MLLSYIFVVGLAVGSFLNVVIDRLSTNQSLLGRSHCDHCKATLQPRDLVPVVSYIWLKGRCRKCHKNLSIQYPLIELVTGLGFVGAWMFYQSMGLGVQLSGITIFACLLALFVSDVKYQILPDEVQIAILIAATGMHLSGGMSSVEILHHIAYGFLIQTPLLALFLVTKGKGMGFGDVKLAFTIGYLFGVLGGGAVLYLSFVLGGLVGIFLLLAKKAKMKQAIAFGPFLILSMMIYMLFEMQISQYLHTIFGV